MKHQPELFVAFRILFNKSMDAGSAGRKSSRLSRGSFGGAVLGIGISLIPLIVVLLVSDGMIEGITNRYMETKTYHLQITLPLEAGNDAQKISNAIQEKLPNLRVFKERSGPAVAVAGNENHAVYLRAVDPSFCTDPGTLRYVRIEDGEFGFSSSKNIVLGKPLAEALRLTVGDTLTVLTPRKSVSGESEYPETIAKYQPKLSFFRVSGIVSSGYHDLDAQLAFIALKEGEKILNFEGASSYIGIKTDKPYGKELDVLQQKTADVVSQIGLYWFEPVFVRSWMQIERSLFRSFEVTRSTLLFIMAIAIAVAAINLSSALLTFVADHTTEIAILRSYGASSHSIGAIFLWSGMLTGAVGTLAGVVLGIALSLFINPIIHGMEWIINAFNALAAVAAGQPPLPIRLLDPAYYLEKIPVTVNFAEIMVITAASLLVCIIASLMPARKASKISVLELFRKD